MIRSKLIGKTYDPSNSCSVYISNMLQAARYLQNGGEDDLVDILYTNTKNDCLVFVFRKTEHIKELYKKWQSHEL